MKFIEGEKNRDLRLAIVLSRFNENVGNGLLSGAMNYLSELGFSEDDIPVIKVPGAFEIPLTAKTLALQKKYDAVICLGAVIKGETAHFEYISKSAADGILQAGLESGVPVIFGVLTAYTEEQAEARSANNESNKGMEAARAAVEMASLIKKLKNS